MAVPIVPDPDWIEEIRGLLPPLLPGERVARFVLALDVLDVEVIDLFAADKASPVVSMYASGIAVMFLLFGAVGNAGSLLEEEESQTMERLMCSQLSMTRLLAGKWLLLWIVGIVQDFAGHGI